MELRGPAWRRDDHDAALAGGRGRAELRRRGPVATEPADTVAVHSGPPPTVHSGESPPQSHLVIPRRERPADGEAGRGRLV
jgi:hypothetical protein